jgi:polyphosphate kinase
VPSAVQRAPPAEPAASGARRGTRPAHQPRRRCRPISSIDRTTLFVNREQSWLAFNQRVLDEALDETVPLLERVKFVAIASLNLDEFFEVRVAGVMELVEANLQGENPDGIKPIEELDRVREQARLFNDELHRTWKDQRRARAGEGSASTSAPRGS